jgi:hypothetical protein
MIGPGVAWAKRVECRLVDGELKIFGKDMPGGKLADACGELVWAKDSKCYWIDEKHAKRSGTPASAAAG